MKDFQVQLIRPPIPIGISTSGCVSFRRRFLGSTNDRALTDAGCLVASNRLSASLGVSGAILGERGRGDAQDREARYGSSKASYRGHGLSWDWG